MRWCWVILVSLAACTAPTSYDGPPKVSGAIGWSNFSMTIAQVEQRARERCASYGLPATLDNTVTRDKDTQLTYFHCGDYKPGAPK